METRETYVHEAQLRLADGADSRAVGAAVTTALCGHWEHEGPCRWPHNNEVAVRDGLATFRTLFVARSSDEVEVRERIEHALQTGDQWAVVLTRARPVSAPELPLAGRLLDTPQA